MNTNNDTLERDEIEALLPWHAAGTLSRKDAQRVERALATDRELAHRYDLVREELASTIELNESLGAPSARAMGKLMAAIDAEAPAQSKASFNLGVWLTDLVSSFSPRTLAWSATAAALAIVLQAGVITGVLINERSQRSFETASHGQVTSAAGSFVLVRFAPQATAADITKVLEDNQAVLVDGPKAGMFRVRVADKTLAKDELERIIKKLQDDKAVGLVTATN